MGERMRAYGPVMPMPTARDCHPVQRGPFQLHTRPYNVHDAAGKKVEVAHFDARHSIIHDDQTGSFTVIREPEPGEEQLEHEDEQLEAEHHGQQFAGELPDEDEDNVVFGAADPHLKTDVNDRRAVDRIPRSLKSLNAFMAGYYKRKPQ